MLILVKTAILIFNMIKLVYLDGFMPGGMIGRTLSKRVLVEC